MSSIALVPSGRQHREVWLALTQIEPSIVDTHFEAIAPGLEVSK